MITPPPKEVISAIENGTVKITRRVEIYYSNGSTFWSPEGTYLSGTKSRMLTGGSISIDMNRDERRTLDIELDNRDGLLRPNPDGGFWYDKVIKVFKGIEYNDDDSWECQVGEFVIDGITEERFPKTVKVVGRDYTKKMILSKFAHSASFPANTKVHDLVKALAYNSGITKVKVPINSASIGRQLDVERGTDRWSIAKDAALSKGYVLYFNATGYLVMEPISDPTYGAVEMVFKTGSAGNLVSYSRSVNDSRLFNYIIVVGESPSIEGGLPYFGQAKNTEPSSPTRIKRLGERVDVVTLASLASDDDAKKLAVSLLKVAGLESFELNFDSISYPWIDADIVARIDDPEALSSDPKRYLIDTVNLPLDLGPMSATAKRVTVVGEELVTEDILNAIPAPIHVPDAGTEPDVIQPEPGVEPEPEAPTATNYEFIRMATYNIGEASYERALSSLTAVAKHSDWIAVQEAGDRLKVLSEFIQNNPEWSRFSGDTIYKRAVTILWRKKLGTVKSKRMYLAHEAQYVGPNGSGPNTIPKKYISRIDFHLTHTNRVIIGLNTHMLPSATRTKKFLGEAEYNARRAHFTKHINEMNTQIDARNGLLFALGCYNAEPDFSLLSGFFSRVTLDHNYNTHKLPNPGRRVDFVCHRAHNAVVVEGTKSLDLSSDHRAAIVTYRIKK